LAVQLEESVAKELASIVNERLAKCFDEVAGLKSRLGVLELRQPERGEKGERGLNGDKGERGDKGETGIIGRDGLPGLPGRDGKDGRDGMDGKDGAAGKDGADGLGFDDVTFELVDNGTSVIERYAKGNVVKTLKRRIRSRHHGPWKHDGEYFFEDSVTSGGSSWMAMVDAPKCKPGEGKDWLLWVRKGRDGKDGERGPPGPVGPPGKDASY
jgi:integrin beta 3